MFDVSEIDEKERQNLSILLSSKTGGKIEYSQRQQLDNWVILLPGAHQYCIWDKHLIGRARWWHNTKLSEWQFAEFVIPNLKVDEPLLIYGGDALILSRAIKAGVVAYEVKKGSNDRELIIEIGKSNPKDGVKIESFSGWKVRAVIIKNETEDELKKWHKENVDEQDYVETEVNKEMPYLEFIEYEKNQKGRLLEKNLIERDLHRREIYKELCKSRNHPSREKFQETTRDEVWTKDISDVSPNQRENLDPAVEHISMKYLDKKLNWENVEREIFTATIDRHQELYVMELSHNTIYKRKQDLKLQKEYHGGEVDEPNNPDGSKKKKNKPEDEEFKKEQCFDRALDYGRWLISQIYLLQEKHKEIEKQVILSFILTQDEFVLLNKAYKIMAGSDGKKPEVTNLTEPRENVFDFNKNLLIGYQVDEMYNSVGEAVSVDREKLLLVIKDEKFYEQRYGDWNGRTAPYPLRNLGGFEYLATGVDFIEKKFDKELMFYLPFRDLSRLPNQSYGVEIYARKPSEDETENFSHTKMLFGKLTGLANGDVYYPQVSGLLNWTEWRVSGGDDNEYLSREQWLHRYRIHPTDSSETNDKTYVAKEVKHKFRVGSRFEVKIENDIDISDFVMNEKYEDEVIWIPIIDTGSPYERELYADYLKLSRNSLSVGMDYFCSEETYEDEMKRTMETLKLTRDEVKEEQTSQRTHNQFNRLVEHRKRLMKWGGGVKKELVRSKVGDLKELKALTKEVTRLIKLEKESHSGDVDKWILAQNERTATSLSKKIPAPMKYNEDE